MPLESIGSRETLLAAWADIWLRASMDANVALEVMFTREGARAHLTVKRLSADMGLEVGFEIVDAGESLGAARVSASHHGGEVIKAGVRVRVGSSGVEIKVKGVLGRRRW